MSLLKFSITKLLYNNRKRLVNNLLRISKIKNVQIHHKNNFISSFILTHIFYANGRIQKLHESWNTGVTGAGCSCSTYTYRLHARRVDCANYSPLRDFQQGHANTYTSTSHLFVINDTKFSLYTNYLKSAMTMASCLVISNHTRAMCKRKCNIWKEYY